MTKIVNCVWKYGMDSGVNTIALPSGAQILGLHQQGTMPVMYALVNPENPPSRRVFKFFPTGGEVPLSSKYVGTVMFNEDRLVYHLFEVL